MKQGFDNEIEPLPGVRVEEFDSNPPGLELIYE